jgi:hypothetical protein
MTTEGAAPAQPAEIPPQLLEVIRRVHVRQHGKPGSTKLTLHYGTGTMLSVVVDEPADEPTARRVERLVLGKRKG